MLRRLPLGPSPADAALALDDRRAVDELVAAEARPAPPGRPWVLVNMVASVDGASQVDGLSGSLGGPADAAVFSAVRAVADVILVGSATATAERYRAHRPSAAQRAARRARGQRPTARLAVVSSRATIDLGLPLFTEGPEGEPDTGAGADAADRDRPIVLVGATAARAHRDAASRVAEVIEAGTDRVDLAVALAALRDRGATTVLCEGGPTLNGLMLAADLVDELCLTVAPTLVGGPADRIAVGAAPPAPLALRLDRALLGDDGALVLRYVRR